MASNVLRCECGQVFEDHCALGAEPGSACTDGRGTPARCICIAWRPVLNVCENGDHPAPDGKRFCSPECAREDAGEGGDGE